MWLLAVDLWAWKHCCSVLCKSCPASCFPIDQAAKGVVAEQRASLRNHRAAVGSGHAAKWELDFSVHHLFKWQHEPCFCLIKVSAAVNNAVDNRKILARFISVCLEHRGSKWVASGAQNFQRPSAAVKSQLCTGTSSVCSSHWHQNCVCFCACLPTSYCRREWKKQCCLLKHIGDEVYLIFMRIFMRSCRLNNLSL